MANIPVKTNKNPDDEPKSVMVLSHPGENTPAAAERAPVETRTGDTIRIDY